MSVLLFLILWELEARSHALLGVDVPWVSGVRPPAAVLVELAQLMGDWSYWGSWYLSTLRVFEGFFAAMIVGIPLGLAMAVSRRVYGIVFPVFEVLRPIPPLA